jgi:flagellar biosynthetic protein FlhB
MADEAYQDRTEEPTPKRRAEAREKGEVPRSRDLNASIVLLTGLFILLWWAPSMGYRSAAMLKLWLQTLKPGMLSPAQVHVLFLHFAFILASLLMPILVGLALVSILANFLQGGWIFSTQRITPDFGRLQIFSGFKRLFSLNSLVELAKALAKVGVIAAVAFLCLRSQLPTLLPLLGQETGQVASYLKSGAFQVSSRIIIALLGLGSLDFLYQRYRHEKSLRMTKQEVKAEMRQVEGDPQIKARLRSLMRQMAATRMMAEVPKADVVITNPTHLAVALKYDSETMIAPHVAAKGQGFIALKIISLAQEAGVPVVENRSLARSLFRLVDVGEAIPGSLYRAVAEVLAYIYGLRVQAGGSR